MHSIEIEEDVFEFLRSRILRIGESPSEILRRELKLPSKAVRPVPKLGLQTTATPVKSAQAGMIADFLGTSEFLVQANVLERFLAVLSWLHKQNPSDFELLLRIFGRKRKYFGRSRSELEQFGSSVMPQQVPKTQFWVVTNTSTETKRTMLQKVMSTLKYDQASIALAVDALR